MATKFLIKRSYTASAAPLLADLDPAELAINPVDGLLFSRDNASNVIRFGIIKQGATTSQLPRFDGTDWVGSSVITNDGTDVSVSNNLTVTATLNTATFQIGGTTVTATAAELNTLDGVTSTAAELNLLDGVTATTAELNYLDISTLGTSQASKAVTADGSGNVVFSGLITGGLWSNNGTANASAKFRQLTQAQYDALTPDANTIYFIEA